MDDRFEIAPGAGVAEDHCAEFPAIDLAVGADDVAAEAALDGLRGRGAGRHDRVGEQVCVNRRDVARREGREDVALARRDAARQRDTDHGARPSAAVTVFLSSSAIVSGPTPPGTGVMAPATCSTAG